MKPPPLPSTLRWRLTRRSSRPLPLPTPPASAGSAWSDGSNATLLAGLENKTVTTAGDPLYNTTILGLLPADGFRCRRASGQRKYRHATSAGASLTQLTQQRDSVTGVSTDSEMINMMKYQRAYQASARFVQTSDDMIGTLINNLFSAN